MRALSSLSIKNRLVAAMLLAVVVSTSVVAFVGNQKTRELLLTRLEQSELPNLVQRVAQEVDGEINQMKALTQSIATSPFIISWSANGESAEARKARKCWLITLAGFSAAMV